MLGFGEIRRSGTRTVGDRVFAVTLEALDGRVPIVVVPPADDLDHASDSLSEGHRRRSAASALQEWLNASEDAVWGLACNGRRLRLMRKNPSLTRPAAIEADLEGIFAGAPLADFSAFWLLMHARSFGGPGEAPGDAPGSKPLESRLEEWRERGSKEGVVARERLRDGVEAALLILGSGFLGEPRNAALVGFLISGELRMETFFNQLLRLVYRLIFLMVAEDRALLHAPDATEPAKRVYAEGYSLARLRERALRRASWDRHDDLWQGLLVAFAALAKGEERLGLPALGGLFDAEMIPSLENVRLPNRALMEAIFRLAWLRDGGALVPVDWRNMQTEELGSVYESLLELVPQLADGGRKLVFAEGAEQKGHARKSSGSYYTPDALVQALLDSALDPVLDRMEAEAENPEQALLGVTVIDPACGSGHFLLAAGRRIASRLARARAGGLASPADLQHALRDVARSCVFGVDRNPFAVELAKVALWIETVDPGKPLGFLDANIREGDSLLGLYDLAALAEGVPDAAYKPLTGDDKATAKYFLQRNRDQRKGQGDLLHGGRRPAAAAPLAEALSALRALPEDRPEEIAEKRRRLKELHAGPMAHAWGEAADLYIAAFLLPKTGGPPALGREPMVPTTGDVWRALAGKQGHPPMVARAVDASHAASAFHWPLEFPDVFSRGGFDVVLGNPPWERIKLQEQEFFAARDADIAAAPNAAARGKQIAALGNAAPGTRPHALHEEFEAAKRLAEASSVFARESGRFPLTGRGDVNTYALFAELFSALASPRGCAGVIVPTGIATADTTKYFFASLLGAGRLVSLYSFSEIRKLFVATDDRNPFCLLAIGHMDGNPGFAFSLDQVGELRQPERRFTLSPDDIARINPNTKTAPVFRSRADAELTAKIYGRVPVLIDEAKGKDGNPWGVSFARLFDMSNDSGVFRTAAQLRDAGLARGGADWRNGAAHYVPLYEAKMTHQFDHRWATYDGLEARDTTLAEKQDPGFEPVPRYWVPEADVADRLSAKNWTRGWLMGWRDICRSTDERTVIAAAFPRVGVNHKTPLFFVERTPPFATAMLANWLSLAFDFVARQKLGGISLTYFYLKQFPVLPPSAYSECDLAFIVHHVVELTCTSHAMAPFARDLGYEGKPFAWDEERRAWLRAELDALYARKYGLTRNELRYILDPEDAMGAGYPSETFRVLKKNEIARLGVYRTARLVLAAWDEQERGALTGNAADG